MKILDMSVSDLLSLHFSLSGKDLLVLELLSTGSDYTTIFNSCISSGYMLRNVDSVRSHVRSLKDHFGVISLYELGLCYGSITYALRLKNCNDDMLLLKGKHSELLLELESVKDINSGLVVDIDLLGDYHVAKEANSHASGYASGISYGKGVTMKYLRLTGLLLFLLFVSLLYIFFYS
jgi:hypothetical protein